MEADGLAEEIHNTYSIFFSRNRQSQKIAEALFKKKNIKIKWCDNVVNWIKLDEGTGVSYVAKHEMKNHAAKAPMGDGKDEAKGTILIEIWGADPRGRQVLSLGRFKHFLPHLVYLQKELKNWNPRKVKEMLTPSYSQRFAWYTAWYGLFFSTLGSLVILIGILQTVIQYKEFKLNQQKV